jgi:esterase/lipase superfamily enzyme
MKYVLYALLPVVFFCSCNNAGKPVGDAATAPPSENEVADSAATAPPPPPPAPNPAPMPTTTAPPRMNKNAVTSVKILYGTDRKMITEKGQPSYGNVPAEPGSPRYSVGYTVVSVPPNHKEGNIETPSIWKLQFREDTTKHMVQKTITKLSDNDFNKMLYDAGKGEDAFIFIHGYNNSFKDAALRTAQLATDIHLPVTPIMFSWSSNCKLASYTVDEDNVQLAVPAFKDFIKRVAQKGNFRKVHLIAHSMGNRLVCMAMQQLQQDTTNLKIDQIIMAAPDVYADLFKLNFAEALARKSQRITIYSAKNDWALLASKKVHKNLRLGEISQPPPVYVFKRVDIIDAVNEKTDFLGHDRFARSPKIIADMDKILKLGADAGSRNIPKKMIGNYLYYYFN